MLLKVNSHQQSGVHCHLYYLRYRLPPKVCLLAAGMNSKGEQRQWHCDFPYRYHSIPCWDTCSDTVTATNIVYSIAMATDSFASAYILWQYVTHLCGSLKVAPNPPRAHMGSSVWTASNHFTTISPVRLWKAQTEQTSIHKTYSQSQSQESGSSIPQRHS